MEKRRLSIKAFTAVRRRHMPTALNHNSRPHVRTQPETLRRVEDTVQHRNARDEFLAYTVKTKRKTTVTSTHGVLTVPARPNIAAKPGQRKRARAERARQ